ncbi:MAG TPA: response regulator [Bauldia sp.]|nr:response regulator [Bauldia sp.]
MPAAFDLTMADGRQPVVALVIDNRATAMVASALVRQFGGRVVAAPGADAMLALLARIARVDLVVVDLALRTMDGFAAAGLVHALAAHRAVPVVALAEPTSDIAGRGATAGLAAAVTKPFSPRELHAALCTALGPRRATVLS